MTPVPLMILGLAVADILAIVGQLTWNEYDMGTSVFAIEALGVMSLFLGGLLASKFYEKKLSEKSGGKHKKPSKYAGIFDLCINIPWWKWAILGVIVALTMVLRAIETYQLAAELGKDTSSYFAAVNAVKNAYDSFKSSEGMKMGVGYSLVVSQLGKTVGVISYVSAVLLAKGIVKKDKRTTIACAILSAECCAYVFLTGGRGSILYYSIAFVFAYALFSIKAGKPAAVLSLRIFVIGAACAAVAAVLFWASSALIGRKANSGLIEYMSFYFGGGIPTLEALLQKGSQQNLLPGTYSFYYIMAIPYKFGLIDTNFPSYSISWFNMGGHGSNIFTGFARYFLDFGYAGVVVLSFAAAFLMTLLYFYIKKTNNFPAIIVTSTLVACSFDFAREEYVFSRFLSTSTIVWVCILLLIFAFLNFENIRAAKKNEP